MPLPYEAHCPPYLDQKKVNSLKNQISNKEIIFGNQSIPDSSAYLILVSSRILIESNNAITLFSKNFHDIEMNLSAHRFSWLQKLETNQPEIWASYMWKVWHENFFNNPIGWHWHPYTASERAINILDFERKYSNFNIFSNLNESLRQHASVILKGLEYFGDYGTSNHLANNGRGLYRIGLKLGDQNIISLGKSILLNESKRIFLPSGFLNEESSHYHLLYTQRYIDVWLAAVRHDRNEAEKFLRIVQRCLSILPHLFLGNRLSLIGDISPDCEPNYLLCLYTGKKNGWLARLSLEERQQYSSLSKTLESCDIERLKKDGIYKGQFGHWSGIWHCARDGWSAMPGHGHQDIGSCELMFYQTLLLVDPGRNRYGDGSKEQQYILPSAHSSLTINDQSSFPINRPYYSKDFRQKICGPRRTFTNTENTVQISHQGFSRISNVGSFSRNWIFGEKTVCIEDNVKGTENVKIVRYLQTPIQPKVEDGNIILVEGDFKFRISSEARGDFIIEPAVLWTSYGKGEEGWRISFDNKVKLPWRGNLMIEVL